MNKFTSEQKEQLKKARREMYRKMKEKKERDPNHIAWKEEQKEKKKAISQTLKKRRAEAKEAEKAEKRKERDSALLKMVIKANEMGDGQ